MKKITVLIPFGLAPFSGMIVAPPVGNMTAETNDTIVLAGHSPVRDNAGRGPGVKQFPTGGLACLKTSRGGTSSTNFLREGRRSNAVAFQGDNYLIQFGRDNEPVQRGRSTDMPAFVVNMEQCVDARATGAKPVLVTPPTATIKDGDHGRFRMLALPCCRI